VVRQRGRARATVRLRPADAPGTASGTGAGLTFPSAVTLLSAAAPAGVPVVEVRAGSAAARAGVRAGDRLVRVGDVPVTTPAAAERALRAPGGAPALLVVARDAVERAVWLPASPAAAPSGQGAP
jgi:S1-C subfamily serine protease